MVNESEQICFVIMPIGDHDDGTYEKWKSIYENVIKPAVENVDSSITLKCIRADEEATSGQITPDIIDHIYEDFLCIADVSEKNANVHYELGLRDSWHNRTITITQDFNDVVFDRSDNRAIRYKENDSKVQSEFNKKMKEAILDILNNPNRVRNKVQEVLDKKRGDSKQNRFRQMMEKKEAARKFARTHMERRISNLLPIMDFGNDNHEIKTPEFFSPYVRVKGNKKTLLLLMNSYDPKKNKTEYLVRVASNLDSLIKSSFIYGIFDGQIEKNFSLDSDPIIKINDISNLLFILPFEGRLNDNSSLLASLKHHFESVRKRYISKGIPLTHNKATDLSTSNGKVKFEVWDIVKLNVLEKDNRLTFST